MERGLNGEICEPRKRQTRGLPPEPRASRGDWIVDDNSVVAADLVQLRQKAGQRETALLPLTEDVAVVADPLPGIEVDPDDTLGIFATIGKAQRGVDYL